MSDRDITARQVRDEHLAEVNEPAHWAYLAAVLIGGTALMLIVVALLGSAAR